MTRVFLRLSGYFRRHAGGRHEVVVSVPDRAVTVRCAASAAGLPADDIGFAMRDGERLQPDVTLQDGDVVTLYPEILGG